MESKANFTNFVLYSYWRSSSSWRVRTVLNLKKIKYEIKPIHLLKAENKSEEFKKINPIEKIPVLEFSYLDKTLHIAESLAICEFLEEIAPEVKLLPTDIVERAKVRSMCCEIACNIQPLQNLPVINRVQELGYNKVDWAKEWIGKGLEVVEKLLANTCGKYSFGDNVTLIDAFLMPQVYNARRFGVDLSQFPNITEVDKNLSSLDEFVASHPDNQPDFEANK
jgi:maleylacetoacetate isomerase